MPDRIATHHQAAFLGGEWSGLSQGRSDLPGYKQALNINLNGIVVEDGAWTRRPAFEWIGFTRGRARAKLLSFISSEATPYLLEFTSGFLQLHFGSGPVCTNDRRTVSTSSYAAGVLTLGLDAVHGWAAGDLVRLVLPDSIAVATRGPFQNRIFRIDTAPTTSSLTLEDDLGAALVAPAALAADAFVDVRVLRIKAFATGYTTTIDALRAVQAETDALILNPAVLPWVLSITTGATGDADPVMAFVVSDLQDGPYLDRQLASPGVPETGAVSAYSGTITFTPATTDFIAADVGRLIRLFSQPAAWASGTTYTYGQTVTHGGTYWKSLAQGAYAVLNVGIVPGTVPPLSTGQSVNLWAPAPLEGVWAWGTIATQATNSCTIVMETALNSVNGTTISEWRLGVFTSGSFPTRGVYHEGRLHLGGAVGNRGDASVSNDKYNFSPTDIYGAVSDANAIAYVFNAKDINTFYWMEPDPQGVLIGTPGGEWLLSASELNDPITPTSRQAHRVTRYKTRDCEPKRIGVALVFVQRYGRRMVEFLADTRAGRYVGKYLNQRAKHLTVPGIAGMEYQEETAPILWAHLEDNTLIGATYRRDSGFITEEPLYEAWGTHALGGGYGVVSMCVLPGVDGLSDKLYTCTVDASGHHGIEVLTPLLEDTDD